MNFKFFLKKEASLFMLNICGLTQNVMKKIKGHLAYPPKLTGVFLYNLLCQTTNVKHNLYDIERCSFFKKKEYALTFLV